MSHFRDRKHCVFQTRLGALLYRARISKLFAYPSRGIQADGSSSPRVPLTWDGNGFAPTGWTKLHARARKHPTLDQWCVVADADVQAALDAFGALRLTLAERNGVQSSVTSAVDLDATWESAAEDDDA
jgi:hypothetical protein